MANQFYGIKELALSHSSRAMASSCMRKLEFRKFFLRNEKDNSFPADVGQCLHTGYQSYMMYKDEERAVWDMTLDYPFETRYDNATNNQRSLEACYATLQAMIASDTYSRYEIAAVKCLDGETRLAAEVPFEIFFPKFSLAPGTDAEIPVRYTGWIDLILYDNIADRYIVVDVKTHRNKNDLTVKYEMDEQCLPYGLVLENVLGRKIENYDVVYLSCFIDILEPVVREYRFTKDVEEIHDWAQGLYYDFKQIEKFYTTGWFPRATSGDTCLAWNRPCQFYDLCKNRRHGVAQEILLLGGEADTRLMDRRGEWNPWIRVPMQFEAA